MWSLIPPSTPQPHSDGGTSTTALEPKTGTSASPSPIGFDILARLYAAATESPRSPVHAIPAYLLQRNPPTVFILPKMDSTHLRAF